MAIQTLSDLRTRVKDWANRTDISDELVDDFINVAQARANRILRLPVLEGLVTLTLDSEGNATLPRDYLEAKELRVSSGGMDVALERKDIHFVEELKSRNDGLPLYFGRKFNEFVFAPNPQNVTDISLYYYIVLDSLVGNDATNWFVTDAPEMLLYGALTELFLYVKNPTAAGQWEAKFRAAMEELQAMADGADWSGDTLSISAYQL